MHNGLRCRECPKWPKPVNASSEKVIGVTSALALVSPVGIWLTWRKCCDEIIAYYLKSKEEFDSLKEKIKGKAYPPCPF
jgi:ABC-type nickel/cobalt efflux system permease component RcnA